jgi:hypothetical protein
LKTIGNFVYINVVQLNICLDFQEEMKLSVSPEKQALQKYHKHVRRQSEPSSETQALQAHRHVRRHTESSSGKDRLVEIHVKDSSSLKVTAKGDKLYIKGLNLGNQLQTGVKAKSLTHSESKQDTAMGKNEKYQMCSQSRNKVAKKKQKREHIGAETHRRERKKAAREQRRETNSADGAPDPKSVGAIGCVSLVDTTENDERKASKMEVTQTSIKKLTNIVTAVAEGNSTFFLNRMHTNDVGHTVYDVDASNSGKQDTRSIRKSNTEEKQQGDQSAKRRVYRFVSRENTRQSPGAVVPTSAPTTTFTAHQSPDVMVPTPVRDRALQYLGSLVCKTSFIEGNQNSPVMPPCAPSPLNAAGNAPGSPRIPLTAPLATKSANEIQVPARPSQLSSVHSPCNVSGAAKFKVKAQRNRKSPIDQKIASVYRRNCIVIPKEGKEWTEEFSKPKETFRCMMPLKKRRR